MRKACRRIHSSLIAYLDDELSDAERVEIEAHLASCAACVERLGQLRALRAGLQDAVPAGLDRLRLSRVAEERIRARLAREKAELSRGRGWTVGPFHRLLRPRPALVKAIIPLIVILFLILAGLVSTLPTPVSAQETIVVSPGSFSPDTDAALRVIVRDVAHAEPISGAQVRVRIRPEVGKEVLLYTGRTDDSGNADARFRVPDTDQDTLAAELIVTSSSSRGMDRVVQPVTVQRSFRVYLTSDKPLYRPGQTIHLRVLALDATRDLPAAERRVLFQVQGINGERVFERSVRTSHYGVAATDYSLPPDAAYGSYRLVAARGNAASGRTVTVGDYERPQFRVDLDPERPYYLGGQVITGQVKARFLDGTPLPDANVSVRGYLHDPERRPIASLQGHTDDAGAFTFRFQLPPGLRVTPTNLALEAAVTDRGGDVEWAGRVVPVAAEPLVVDVVAEGGRIRPGVENVVHILVTTPDGAPASAHLSVEAAGMQTSLSTGPYGLASLQWTPDLGAREVPIQVAARDVEGRQVTHTTVLSADRGPAQILLRLDRAAYEVGGTIHAEILSGQGETAYVDVVHRGQRQTISTHIARLERGKAQLALDTSPQMIGTLELHAYQVLPDGTLAHDARLAVVDAPQPVEVAIRSDRTSYRPGDVAHIAVDTRLDAVPVQSAMGIAVVDESVFALEERAPGFAKLFFLLDESLLEASVRPAGLSLAEILDPTGESDVRAAQDKAARAAWARLPPGQLDVARSGPGKAQAAEMRTQRRFQELGYALSTALLLIPAALWIVLVRKTQHDGSWGPPLWRTALLLSALAFALLLPATAGVLVGLHLLLGPAIGRTLLPLAIAGWLGALIGLGIGARRRGDEGVQVLVLLIGAHGILAGLMGYVGQRGGDPGLGLIAGTVGAFAAALAALLFLTSMLWLERHKVEASTALALVLLSVAIAVLAGTTFATKSLFAQTWTDPRLYVGPVSWLSGCAAKTEEPESTEEASRVVVETVMVEQEVTQVVEKEAAEGPGGTSTALSTPTAVATSLPTASPPPSATPTPLATATMAPGAAPEPPLPLLGQFVPETIYWAPEAVTDSSGHLDLEIPLPEIETTWRLTALASTQQGQLGASTALLHVGR